MISASAAVPLFSENSRKDGCTAIMQGYTDASAFNEMKNAYSECVVKVLPTDTYQQPPTIEAKMFVLALLIGWIASIIISTIKLKDGIFVGILGGTVFYTAFLIITSIAVTSLLFIFS